MTATTSPSGLALAALAGATLLAAMGSSIAAVALPSLAAAFPATAVELQWVILAYLLTMTVTVVVAGRLGDLYGHRRLLVIGLMLFTVASLAGAASPDLSVLFAARAVQGIGGAVLMAMPMSIARSTVAAGRAGMVMGLLGSTSAIGTALGPSLGGALMVRFGWQAAFVLPAAGGLLVAALAVAALPVAGSTGTQQRMDWAGTALLTIGLGLYAMVAAGALGFSVWSIGMLLLAGLIIGLFVISQKRAESPLVPMALLGDRSIGMGLATNLLVGAVMMATLVVGALFLSFGLGLDESSTGLVMAVGPVVAALAGIPTGRLCDRIGYGPGMVLGLVEIAVGTACLGTLPIWFGEPGYIVSLVILTPGFQLFLAANNAAVMQAAPKEQRGTVSGLLGLSRNLGLLTGASAMSTLFAALVGEERIAAASAATIGGAFTAVFLLASGLAVIGLGLTIYGRPRAA